MRQRQQQKVILVPDPRSPGTWMREVRRAFEPHFGIEEISHRDCRFLLPLALAVEPSSVLAAILALCILAPTGLLRSPWVYFVAGVLLLGAATFARWARDKLRDCFESELSRVGPGASEQHLVAHGFGTYLAGQALKFPGRRLRNVILGGAMLPMRFDWEALFHGNPKAFQRLRNDFGRGGEWPWLALISRLLCADLGFAGLWGFRVTPDGAPGNIRVHNADVDGKCQNCVAPAGVPSVHNVRLQVSTRSDQFIGFDYASLYWRPFLWDIVPREYQVFLALCQEGTKKHRADPRDPELSILLEEFGESPWEFLGRRTMGDVIEERAPGKSKAWKENCYTRMWALVSAARDKEEAKVGDARELEALKPQVAIQKVVENFLIKGHLV